MKKVSNKLIREMNIAFREIQQPRTPYTLKDLIVDTKFTDEQKYAQCVLEMNIAYNNLRTANCDYELKQIEIKELKGKDRKTQLEKIKKEIELEQLELAMLGAEREFTFLFNLWQKRPKRYTRDELNNAQPEEYRMMLLTQAKHDMVALGRVSQSNCE